MPNHPNRNWRSRWTVNLATCTATHRNGWVFRFTQDSNDKSAWDGECIDTPQPLTMEHLRIAQRIAREAGDVYIEALQERH